MVTSMRQPELEPEPEEQFNVDPDDLVADVTDEELVVDLLSKKPTEGEAEACCLIVDNIPTVSSERVDKLKTVMGKYFKKFGEHTAEFALDDEGGTKGYVFVEFATKEAALEAAEVLNGYALDKKHTLSANLFCDLHKKPETRLQPERPYKDPGRLHWWLEDGNSCVDEFAVVFQQGTTVAVYNNTMPEPTLVSDSTQRLHWTESTIEWSPRGTYLATFHEKGIALWGGPEFQRARRFAHTAVSSIAFSPNEDYMVSFSTRTRGYGTTLDALKIWNARTEELERSFSVGPNELDHRVESWPYFRWSHDGQYFAALKEDQAILIYETRTFKLLDGKPWKCEGIRDFQWSPKDNLLAFWVSEKQARPATVGLLSVPDKVEVRTKNLFKVVDAWLHWQGNGDYLAIKIDRYGKKKEEEGKPIKYTSMSYHLEVFRVREKGIPVETIELKEPVVNLAWEPQGDRICMLLGSERKSAPTFYSFGKGTTSMIKQLEGVVALNAVQWAPAGQWLVLASLRSTDAEIPASGTLMFIDCSTGEPVRSNQIDHAACSSIHMDPTGRFCVSVVSYWVSRGADFGYRMYTSQGRVIQKQAISGLCLLAWRPRPPPILPEAKIKEIRRNMRQFAQKYEEQDKRERSRASKDVLEKRRAIVAEFEAWHEAALAEVAELKEYRIELRGMDTDPGCAPIEEMEEETIEMPIESKRIVLEVYEDDE